MLWVYSLMLAFTLAAAVSDLVRQKIYNALVYPGILVAIGANWLIPEARGLQDSLLGLAVCGGSMLVAAAFFDVGGGDVKLLGMMGAFLGLYGGALEAMLWTFVIGMVLAIAILIWRVGASELLARAWHHVLLTLKYRQPIPLETGERAHLQSPLKLAPAALAGELIVLANAMQLWPTTR